MPAEQFDGSHSYQGYEYQILATVWVALELIFRRRFTTSIVIEPASKEDVSADLDVEPEEAVSALQVGESHEQHLEIQIKLRRTGHWTPDKFGKLVLGNIEKSGSRGPKRRNPPIDLLRSSTTNKFILLTNAQVADKLLPYVIEKFGELSDGSIIPGEPHAADSYEVSSRIGILQQREARRLRLEIDKILMREGHLPLSRCDSCVSQLKEAVRIRLLGQSEQTWTREEIVALMQKAGGFPELKKSPLVRPSNYDQIVQQILEKFSLLLCGPPGIGKTFLAEYIADNFRLEEDPFEVVIVEKVSDIKKRINNNYKLLFFLNDPWGHYKLKEDADRWTSELPKLLKEASTHKRFIITSRIGIKTQATKGYKDSELSSAEIFLTEEHYDSAKLIKILEMEMGSSKPWQQDFVKLHRSKIVDKLKIPYSLVVFAKNISKAVSRKDIKLSELISQSNIEVIGSNLGKEIVAMGPDSVASAVVLWAFMMIYPYIKVEDADWARRIIRNAGYQNPIDPKKLFRWLLDAKWIQQMSEGFTSHPTVLEGLESLIDQDPTVSEEVLLALLAGLVQDQKANVAHKIVKQLKGRILPIPEVVHNAINLYLLDRLSKATGHQFNEAFGEIGQWSTGADSVSALVQILLKRKKNRNLIGDYEWPAPELTSSQLGHIASSRNAKECASKFITEFLTEDFNGYVYSANDLVSFFNLLGWDMSEDFLAGAEKGLDRGNSEIETLMEGALCAGNTRNKERLLKAALNALDEANEWLSGFHEEYRRAEQAELNADYANYVFEQPQERFAPINTALKAIVSSRRKTEGYKWLMEHDRVLDLLEGWVETINESTKADEIRAILRVCPASDRRHAWKAIQKARLLEFVPEVIKGLEASPSDQIGLCIEALTKLLTLDQWKEKAVPAVQPLPFGRRGIIWMVVKGLNEKSIEDAPRIVDCIESTLNPAEAFCLSLCNSVSDKNAKFSPPLDKDVKDLLCELADSTPNDLSIRAVFALARMDELFASYLPGLLKCEDATIRLNALKLSVSLSKESAKNILYDGLSDKDYRCRREAMWLLSENATEVDKELIVDKANDPSAPVRDACAQIIGFYRWEEAQSVLVKILSDDRDASQDHLIRFHVPNYHVARSAALSLAKMETLSPSTIDLIIEFAKKRDEKKDDLVVYYHILDALSWQYGHRVLLFLEGFLDDPWYMPGIKLNGYPLRYAAAWGVFHQLIEDGSLTEIVPMGLIFKGAVHTDSRLAGPCLLCLGLIGERAQHKILQALQAGAMTPERALLILGTLPGGCQYIRGKLLEFIGPSNPALLVFEVAINNPSLDEEDWKAFLEKNVDTAKWLDGLQSLEDVNQHLQVAFNNLFQEPICQHFMTLEELRKNEIAESIPIMTMRSMFGGE
jgi:hypothetical protein